MFSFGLVGKPTCFKCNKKNGTLEQVFVKLSFTVQDANNSWMESITANILISWDSAIPVLDLKLRATRKKQKLFQSESSSYDGQ